jgi:hypothetical protein
MKKTFLFLFVIAILQDPVARRLPVQAGSLQSVSQTAQLSQGLNRNTPSEGSTYFLLGGGLIGLAMWTRRRRA